MATPVAIGKNYGEIWRDFQKEYGSVYSNPADLKRIHNKWRQLAAECK